MGVGEGMRTILGVEEGMRTTGRSWGGDEDDAWE